MLGKQLNSLLRRFGFKLVRIEDRVWYVGALADGVATLIDVGAAFGTPYFYDLNRRAELFLIDPLDEYEDSILDILKRRSGGYEITALGKESGTTEINVWEERPTKSSILKHTDLTRPPGKSKTRQVPLKTLDEVVRSHALKGPFGIKIDAEGKRLPYLYELVFAPVTDYNATMLKFQTGDSHLLDPVRPEDVSLIEDEAEYQARKREEIVSAGESVLGVFLGRRSSRAISTAARKRRMTAKAKADIAESKAAIADIQEDLAELQEEMREEALDKQLQNLVDEGIRTEEKTS